MDNDERASAKLHIKVQEVIANAVQWDLIEDHILEPVMEYLKELDACEEYNDTSFGIHENEELGLYLTYTLFDDTECFFEAKKVSFVEAFEKSADDCKYTWAEFMTALDKAVVDIKSKFKDRFGAEPETIMAEVNDS